ncbi:MAG TPA: hypothetical protein VN248_04545, partial [Arenimonas sp.]|nr:hypothetical protein [Arenimonas sp.]
YKPRVLALDMSRVFDIEYSALQMLIEGERRMTAEGHAVWLADLSPAALECARASGFADRLEKDGRLFFNAREVIRHYQENYTSNTLPASTANGVPSGGAQ